MTAFEGDAEAVYREQRAWIDRWQDRWKEERAKNEVYRSAISDAVETDDTFAAHTQSCDDSPCDTCFDLAEKQTDSFNKLRKLLGPTAVADPTDE
jgi:hypothetical protein